MSSAVGRPADIDAAICLIRQRAGLTLSPGHFADAETRVRRAMGRAGMVEGARYLELVQTSTAAFHDLVAEFTVGETYFFREPSQLDFIQREVLPEIARRAGPGEAMRIWSAGCASGEEAYTLAILLDEAGFAARSRIIASDISRPALARAKAAVYGSWSLRGVDAATTRKHFHAAHGRYALDERIRERVGFMPMNLAADDYPAPAGPWCMDLILCRNVLIYFDREAVKRAAERLFATLAPGGWLILGPSDPPLAMHAPFETVVSPHGVFYRRPGAPAAQLAAPVALPPRFEVPALAPIALAPPDEVSSAAIGDPADALAAARAALAAGDYGRAVALAETVAGPDAAALSIDALANRDGASAAAARAAEAAKRHPLCAELHLRHAVLLADTGRPDEAMQALRRALYLDRSLVSAHVLLGVLLAARGDREGARRARETAASLAAKRAP